MSYNFQNFLVVLKAMFTLMLTKTTYSKAKVWKEIHFFEFMKIVYAI